MIKYHTDMPADIYHADPCESPSLSSSMAATFITSQPCHVLLNSKRLNPAWSEESSDAKDKGQIMHDIVLMGEHRAEILDFADWRTNAAKDARAAAAANGKIAVLSKDWPEYEVMRGQLFKQIDCHEEHFDALRGGDFESSLFWEESGTNFRCRFDHVNFESGWIDDYKTTGTSISQWIRSQLFGEAKDVQAALYERGYAAYKGTPPKGFRYIVQETYAPYCMAVVQLDTRSLQIGHQRLDWAVRQWNKCLSSGKWPGYEPKTHWASIPAYLETEWEWKLANEEIAA